MQEKVLLYLLLATGISFMLTMVTLVDIIKKDFKDTKTKLIWHFVALIPIIGFVVYFVIGAKTGTKRTFS